MLEAKFQSARARMKAALAGFWAHQGGIAAIEFAMILPLLLGTSFMTMEVGQAIEASRKLSRGTATIGLVATQQNGTVSKSELEAMMSLGTAALQPYNRSGATFTVTGVKLNNDATPKAVVTWSRSLARDANGLGVAGTGRPKGQIVQIPDSLRTPNSFVVLVESDLAYKPLIAWGAAGKSSLGLGAAFLEIKMGDESYQATRDYQDLVCSDC